jgi:DNA-binding NtrC family response regulator
MHTVLVVDDDAFQLRLIESVLASPSCRVVTLADAARTLPTIEWEAVDLLVCDIAMPDVSGLDLVVRARQIFPHVPRLLLTAHKDFDLVQRAINEGEVFRFLTKPFDPQELRDAVDQGLARAAASRDALRAERAAERRRAALLDLEYDHPGIGTVVRSGERYAIDPARAAELERRVRGTSLGPLADG